MSLLFRYSGNKEKLLKFYRKPPTQTKRIVELFLGSGAFSIEHSNIPAIGFEIHPNLCEMWEFLRQANKEQLEELREKVEKFSKEQLLIDSTKKPNVKLMNLPKGEETYVRINCTSVYTGQLSSWSLYPQHKLPIDKTLAAIPRIQQIEVVNKSFETYQEKEGDLVFCDPPYVGTIGNYGKHNPGGSTEKNFDPNKVRDFLKTLKNNVPVIFTYGTSCEKVFPDFKWEKVLEKKVPNIRCGGTVNRTENVSYLNWP